MDGSQVRKWRQTPDNAVILDGIIYAVGDEVGTREAAEILGLSQRRVQSMCDEGILAEGRDWRRTPCRSGHSHYRIKRAALKVEAR
jgi:hypothetical protein